LALSFLLFGSAGYAAGKTIFFHDDADTSFLLAVEDAFFVSGSGVVVTGVIESGTVVPGMSVEIRGGGDKVITATVGFISMYTKQVGSAKKGDAVGLNLKGIQKDDVKRGMVITRPNTIHAYQKIQVSLTLLATDNGGQAKPIQNDQSVQVLTRTEIVSANILTPAEIKPGETATVSIKLAYAVPFRHNDKIAIKYSGKIIGNGVITKLE
jgi:elongation factor Tu